MQRHSRLVTTGPSTISDELMRGEHSGLVRREYSGRKRALGNQIYDGWCVPISRGRWYWTAGGWHCQLIPHPGADRSHHIGTTLSLDLQVSPSSNFHLGGGFRFFSSGTCSLQWSSLVEKSAVYCRIRSYPSLIRFAFGKEHWQHIGPCMHKSRQTPVEHRDGTSGRNRHFPSLDLMR